MSRDIKEIPIEKILSDPNQPRDYFDPKTIKELMKSIKSKGLIQPIIVAPVKNNKHRIICGERRYRACKSLGLKTIAAIIQEKKDRFIMSLIENIQRENLSPTAEALAYKKLLNEGLKQKDLVAQTGKSQSYIAQKLRLLKLPKGIIKMLDTKIITEGHARQLLRIDHIIDDLATTKIEDFLGKDLSNFFSNWTGFFQIMLCEEYRPAGTVAEFTGWINKFERNLCLVAVSGYGKSVDWKEQMRLGKPASWHDWLKDALKPEVSKDPKKGERQIRIACDWLGKFDMEEDPGLPRLSDNVSVKFDIEKLFKKEIKEEDLEKDSKI